jgi:hypothetical protein
MNTTKGRDTFNVIKGLGSLMEWSYGFDVLEKSEGKFPEGDENGKDVRFLKSLKVHEVSPVILGAGENTRTLSAKRFKQTGAYEPDDIQNIQAVCLQIMGELNGSASPARLAALMDQLESALNIPEGDADEATNIGTASTNPGEIKLTDHLIVAESIMDTVVTRVADVMAMRTEKGKQLSEETFDLVQKLASQLERLREVVAIDPRNGPQQRQLTEAIFRDARALLTLTGGSNGS